MNVVTYVVLSVMLTFISFAGMAKVGKGNIVRFSVIVTLLSIALSALAMVRT